VKRTYIFDCISSYTAWHLKPEDKKHIKAATIDGNYHVYVESDNVCMAIDAVYDALPKHSKFVVKVADTDELIECWFDGTKSKFLADIEKARWPKLDPAQAKLYNG
jgi:hypothetical protein